MRQTDLWRPERVSDAGRLRDDAASSGPASESLQWRKPRWGDVGRCRMSELSCVKQPSADQEDRVSDAGRWRDDAASSGPASESLQWRKPRWGDVGRCRMSELSCVKQPPDDRENPLWCFNV